MVVIVLVIGSGPKWARKPCYTLLLYSKNKLASGVVREVLHMQGMGRQIVKVRSIKKSSDVSNKLQSVIFQKI